MRVDRCVCYNQSFTDLLAMHEDQGLSLDQLSEQTGCCTGCGMCEPYLRLALATGESELPPMPEHELERRIAEATRTR